MPDAPATAPPFAVLLLAWDEAAPAVRAVLEAMQTPAAPLPRTLVVVPGAAAPPSPAAATEPTVAPSAASLSAEPVISIAAPLPTKAAVEPEASALKSAADTELSASDSEPEANPNSGTTVPAATPAAPLAWPAVQVVRLASFSLPELAVQVGRPLPAPVWTGPASAPAAPYLGATNEQAAAPSYPAAPEKALSTGEALSAQASAVVLPTAPLSSASRLTFTDASPAPLLVPGHLAASPFFASPTDEPDAPLDPDFPTINPAVPALTGETAAAETETVAWPARLAPSEVASWPAALASLQVPAEMPVTGTAIPSPIAAEMAPSHAVLQPAQQALTAPDLNFQIIQYARFAVPVALAAQPFEVLYAPSWPTWLAAQELRQRTGRPLVLHVEALAAGAESADTATGWVAELQRQALRRADLVLTETHALASRLRRELGLPAHAVRVVSAADTAGIARALSRAHVHPLGSPAGADE
ncbi:MAG: glycosyltransferase [Janthinobacterium lividum]